MITSYGMKNVEITNNLFHVETNNNIYVGFDNQKDADEFAKDVNGDLLKYEPKIGLSLIVSYADTVDNYEFLKEMNRNKNSIPFSELEQDILPALEKILKKLYLLSTIGTSINNGTPPEVLSLLSIIKSLEQRIFNSKLDAS